VLNFGCNINFYLFDAFCQNFYAVILCIFLLQICCIHVYFQDATAVAVCSKKTSNAESTHVLDFMLEEPESAVDEDLPAGPKRCNIVFIISHSTH